MHRMFPITHSFLISVFALGLIGCADSEAPSESTDKSMTVAEMLAEQRAQEESASEAPDSGAAEDEFGSAEPQIAVFDTYLATIHSFTAPEDSQLVNSHIIETDNMLVLIDGQYLRPYANKLKEYIDTLGKPLDRVYLSHAHPDHWFGLEFFPDTPVYAQQSVADELMARGEADIAAAKEKYEGLTTDTLVVVDQILRVHSDIIDGLTYEFELVEEAEADFQTLIRLPEVDVAFVQDLISNKAHSDIGEAALERERIQSWIRHLAVFSVDAQDSQIFVGHGYPARADASVIKEQIDYLQSAKEILLNQEDMSEEALSSAMKTAFPNYGAASIVDSESPL